MTEQFMFNFILWWDPPFRIRLLGTVTEGQRVVDFQGQALAGVILFP